MAGPPDVDPSSATSSGRPPADKRSVLQSVERAVAVLQALATQPDPRSIVDLAASLGVDRTIIRRILRTLEAEEFVEPAPGGGYLIGPRALVFGNAYRERLSLRSAALPYMSDFVRALGERQLMVSIAAVVHRELLLVDQVWNPGMSLDLVFDVGSRFPVGESASGRALLAYMSREEIADTVGAEQGRKLEPRLLAIRAAGGVDFQRRPDQQGHCAIAAVIFPRYGRPRSTLVLSGLGLEDELCPDSPSARQVRRYADRIGDLI